MVPAHFLLTSLTDVDGVFRENFITPAQTIRLACSQEVLPLLKSAGLLFEERLVRQVEPQIPPLLEGTCSTSRKGEGW